MGLTLLKRFADMGDKYQILMVNRGKNYWDRASTNVLQSNQNIRHCKADRSSDSFVEKVSLSILETGLPLTHVVDFSCYNLQDCTNALLVIEQVKNAGSQPGRLRYIFISTDSTYDASAFLLDQHRHKFIPAAFLKPDQASKPKLPKHDRRLMYSQAYSSHIALGGISEECAYSPTQLKSISPTYSSHVNPLMYSEMETFLKDFDSYGYKKILCEELFAKHAAQNNTTIEFVALRLADVIGPYDETHRLWKYVTWIKTLLGQPTRLSKD